MSCNIPAALQTRDATSAVGQLVCFHCVLYSVAACWIIYSRDVQLVLFFLTVQSQSRWSKDRDPVWCINWLWRLIWQTRDTDNWWQNDSLIEFVCFFVTYQSGVLSNFSVKPMNSSLVRGWNITRTGLFLCSLYCVPNNVSSTIANTSLLISFKAG
jgi:hypothetical protein